MMRVCMLTSMHPTASKPHSGVFITRRIEAMRENGVSVDAYAVVRQETRMVQLIRKAIGKPCKELFGDTIQSDNPDVVYKTLRVKLGFVGFLLTQITHEKYYAQKAAKVAKAQIKEKYDLVHAHWLFPTGMTANEFAKDRNLPCVITCHGSDINREMKNTMRRTYCIKALAEADVVEFVSEKLMKTAKSYGGMWKKAIVLSNGIVQIPEDHHVNRNHTVGFVGNLIPVKRVDCFPSVFKKIYKAVPNVNFVIVGEGHCAEWLKEELSGLPVHFTGRIPQSDVFEEMEKMRVMILPSRNEGWPCVVLEAHACGTPVIGSDCGGIPEAIDDDRLVVEDNADLEYFASNFADKVIELLSGEICVNSEQLKKRAKDYRWSCLQAKEREMYEKLIQEKQ